MLLKNTKVCSKCGKEKNVSEFYKKSDANDGLQCWCKSCHATSNNESKLKRLTKQYNAYIERLRYYKNKHGLSYRLFKNNFEKRHSKLNFICLNCGCEVEEPLFKAAEKKFICGECFNKKITKKSKYHSKCSCGHNCQNHNQENKVVEYPMMTDDWIKYLRELRDNDNPQHLETIKIVYFPVSAQVETQSNKTKENLPKKENIFIKWLKKLFNKK